jgi:glutathione S-transferase
MNPALTLIIGTPRYSTWSLRPWLLLKALNLPFDTREITLRQPDTKDKILEISPSGKIPLLIHGNRKIWDSLAIAEYLAETYPQAHLWPLDPDLRAWARSISAEMHAGFQALRSACPMDLGLDSAKTDLDTELRRDISRIEAIWTECLDHNNKNGPFLFGSFSIADAMYAPVVTRFVSYHLPRNSQAQAYCQTIMDTAWMQDWRQMAMGS